MAGEIRHEWHGTTLVVTSDSGTSSCNLKGDKGDMGVRGAQGACGKRGDNAIGETIVNMVFDAESEYPQAGTAVYQAITTMAAAQIKPTVSGNPIVVNDSADLGFKLSIYGKDVQSESIAVMVYGKNLFNNDTSLVVEMSITKDDGGVRTHWGRAISLPAGTYTISARTASTDTIYLYGCTNKKDGTFGQQCSLWQNKTYKGPHTITVEDGDMLYFYEGIGYTGEAVRNIFAVFDIQIEAGTSVTAFEPYKVPQTMTINIPNGLLGKSVSSGGNYTDENGQQLVCDEIDLARGVYIKRIDPASGEVMATPTETALSAEELEDFSTLHTNKPNTTICNNVGAEMALTYVADTKAYIDNKFNELATAIVANG